MTSRCAWSTSALVALGLTGCALIAGLGEATPAEGGAAASGSSGTGGSSGEGGSSGSSGSSGSGGTGGTGASGGDASGEGGGGTAGTAGGTYAGAVLADQPLAYFRLGELSGTKAFDSAADYTGVYTGQPLLGVPGAISGDSNTAVRFDGTHPNNVQLGDVLDLAGGDFSIEVWVKPLLIDQLYRSVISKWIANAEGYALTYDEDQGMIFVMMVASKWHGVSTTLPMNVFSHVVITYEAPMGDAGSGKLTLYVDGTAVHSSGAPPLKDTDALLVIGAASDGYNTWNGEIDEVAIYGKALDVSRVKAHYAAGVE